MAETSKTNSAQGEKQSDSQISKRLRREYSRQKPQLSPTEVNERVRLHLKRLKQYGKRHGVRRVSALRDVKYLSPRARKGIGQQKSQSRLNEKNFSQRAAAAVQAAVDESVKAGLTITVVENNSIVEIAPDGSRKVIKDAPEQLNLEAGSTFNLK